MCDAVCCLPSLGFQVYDVVVTITGLWGHFSREPITRTNFLTLSCPLCVCICPGVPLTLIEHSDLWSKLNKCFPFPLQLFRNVQGVIDLKLDEVE